MTTVSKIFAACLLVGGALITRNADAYVIDFDSAGLTGPSAAASTSAGTIDVPTPIGTVVFSGGAILTNELSLPADTTSVYYTSFFLSAGVNPITITFPTNILNFNLNVYNGETYSDPFTVSDNTGNTNTVTLPNNTSGGTALISFPAGGNIVTISTTDTSGFDFSIDDISFDQTATGVTTLPGTPTVPEPAALTIFCMGLASLGLLRRRA
jgi:hypothetical protein